MPPGQLTLEQLSPVKFPLGQFPGLLPPVENYLELSRFESELHLSKVRLRLGILRDHFKLIVRAVAIFYIFSLVLCY